MLSEEALVLVGALVVVWLLILGVLEVLWPTRPGRRPPPPPVLRAHPGVPAGAIARLVPPPAEDDLGSPPVERCARLLARGRHAEAAALAHAALAGAPRFAPADRGETARLWSLLARACWGRGEGEPARRAMESAIGVAPANLVPTYQQQLVQLVVDAVPALLRDAAAESAAPSRLAVLREALAWVAAAEETGAADTAVADLGVEVQAALWPVLEQVARGLLQRHDFGGARQLLSEGLTDPRLPQGYAETFRALLRRLDGGEVGHVTAQAVRSVQQGRETDALGCLRRAARLLAALDEEVLPSARREELSRRVSWSYARLGARRMEAGDFDAALELLFHALRFETDGPGEGPGARTGLVQALERVVEARAAEVRRHVDTGDPDAALDASRRLWRLLETASERGLGEDVLGEARETAQRVTRELSGAFTRR